MTDELYADDLSLLVNTPIKEKYLLQSLEQAAGHIGLYMYAPPPIKHSSCGLK